MAGRAWHIHCGGMNVNAFEPLGRACAHLYPRRSPGDGQDMKVISSPTQVKTILRSGTRSPVW